MITVILVLSPTHTKGSQYTHASKQKQFITNILLHKELRDFKSFNHWVESTDSTTLNHQSLGYLEFLLDEIHCRIFNEIWRKITFPTVLGL